MLWAPLLPNIKGASWKMMAEQQLHPNRWRRCSGIQASTAVGCKNTLTWHERFDHLPRWRTFNFFVHQCMASKYLILHLSITPLPFKKMLYNLSSYKNSKKLTCKQLAGLKNIPIGRTLLAKGWFFLQVGPLGVWICLYVTHLQQ